MRLNTELIRRRRRELRLSERELGERLGTSRTTIRYIESGEVVGKLTLGFMDELAIVLGVEFAGLIVREQAGERRAAADVERLGALLAEAEEATPLDLAAEVLCWTVERTKEAADDLAAALPRVGMVLHTADNQLRVLPAATVLSPEELRQRTRRSLARNHLTSHQARVLLAYVERDPAAVRKLGGREFTAVALLAKAGLIEDGARGSGYGGDGMGVADEVAFSLLL
jgi:transcriptional regulator with XRE-family HTH domain